MAYRLLTVLVSCSAMPPSRRTNGYILENTWWAAFIRSLPRTTGLYVHCCRAPQFFTSLQHAFAAPTRRQRIL